MVSALDSGSNGPGLRRGRDTALYSWARHFTLVKPLLGTSERNVDLMLGEVTLRWTSIPSRGGGSGNTPSSLML